MKKQIFNLMLSATIFTTNPLFAMVPKDEDLNPSGKEISHKCSLCQPTLMSYKLTPLEEELGNGVFNSLQKELLIEVISILTLKDVSILSSTSKIMHNLCHTSIIWEGLIKNKLTSYSTLLCAKNQLKNYYDLYFYLFIDKSRMDPKTVRMD